MTAPRSYLEGRVTLHAGDALEIAAELPDASIDAVITDPPYCSGAITEAGKSRATHQGIRSETMRNGRFRWFGGDNMTTGGLVWLLRSLACESLRIVRPSGHLLVFCDWRMAPMLAPALESAGWRFQNIVVWDKGSFGTGLGFRPSHEFILHLTAGSPAYHAADVGNVLRTGRIRSSEREHPTQKPVRLIRDLIRVTVPVDGTVLDPFAGSGTTAQAAIEEGRRAVLVERDEGWLESIDRRFSSSGRDDGPTLFSEAAE